MVFPLAFSSARTHPVRQSLEATLADLRHSPNARFAKPVDPGFHHPLNAGPPPPYAWVSLNLYGAAGFLKQ